MQTYPLTDLTITKIYLIRLSSIFATIFVVSANTLCLRTSLSYQVLKDHATPIFLYQTSNQSDYLYSPDQQINIPLSFPNSVKYHKAIAKTIRSQTNNNPLFIRHNISQNFTEITFDHSMQPQLKYQSSNQFRESPRLVL